MGVAVTLGLEFEDVATKLCFRDKSQLKWRFWWMGVCSERVKFIPNVWWCGANFVEAYMILSLFMAQHFVRLLRFGSAIFVAGAGNREVGRCGGDLVAGAVRCACWRCGRKFSRRAQGIVRLRVVVEVNVAVTLGLACERALFGGAGLAKLLGRAA